jgi:hypothetical protein
MHHTFFCVRPIDPNLIIVYNLRAMYKVESPALAVKLPVAQVVRTLDVGMTNRSPHQVPASCTVTIAGGYLL